MRTLPRYMILSYIGPFLMTFFIAVFVLFLQFIWKYVDDLVGKGLPPAVLLELFFYVALNTFPLALPLAILLSSLMTFGNLGEQFELVALKSAGMSLQKIMMPLSLLALLTTIGAFLFSNNVLPFVNLKWQSLIHDIQEKKPALNIKEGIFYNGIDGYTIRIGKKESDGINCSNLMIYDHSQGAGNNKVITAHSGKLELTADKQFLNIVLFNGTSFEEMDSKEGESHRPLVRSTFKEQVVRFDLSGFRMVRTEEELFKSNYEMLNITQIEAALDSLAEEKKAQHDEFIKKFSEMLSEASVLKTLVQKNDSSGNSAGINAAGMSPNIPGQLKQNETVSTANRSQTIDMALNIARSKKYFIESRVSDADIFTKPVTSLNIVWHKKFTLSIACLILFFVGAPLGAIIRKGGLGMPVVVSVIIFILYWVVSITGEKMSKEGVIPPYAGMWIATAVTLPLGIFLTSKATSDSALFDSDAYAKFFRKILWKKK